MHFALPPSFLSRPKWRCSAISMTIRHQFINIDPTKPWPIQLRSAMCTTRRFRFSIIVLYDYAINFAGIFSLAMLHSVHAIGSSKYCDMIQVFLIIINISGKCNVNLFVWQLDCFSLIFGSIRFWDAGKARQRFMVIISRKCLLLFWSFHTVCLGMATVTCN